MSDNTQEPNANLVRTVWRRFKKDLKEAIIRDLQPKKDIKGGNGVKGASRPTTGGDDTKRGH